MAEVEIPIPDPSKKPAKEDEHKTTSTLDAKQPIKFKGSVDGSALKKSESTAGRIKEAIFAESFSALKDHVVYNIVLPSVRRTLHDIVTGAADLVFGGSGSRSLSSSLYSERGVTYPRSSYKSYSNSTRSTRGLPDRTGAVVYPSKTATRPRNFHLDEVIFDQYDDASDVLTCMIDFLTEFKRISVTDFYDLLPDDVVPERIDYTAQNWGWRDLDTAYIANALGGGYVIKLPRPVVI